MTAIEQIYTADHFLQKSLSSLTEANRGHVSQEVLLSIRHLLDSITVILVSKNQQAELTWATVDGAKKSLPSISGAEIVKKMYKQIQGISSHYMVDETNSEHFINSYIAYIIELRHFLKIKLNISILENIETLCSRAVEDLQSFYEQIYQKLEQDNGDNFSFCSYIMSQKPVIINGNLLYEISLSDSKRKSNKLGNTIAFSKFRVPFEYRVNLNLQRDTISLDAHSLPILKIVDFEYAIKSKEINKLGAIVGLNCNISKQYNEYKNLMYFMRMHEICLHDIILSSDEFFSKIIRFINSNASSAIIEGILRKYREIIISNQKGTNILNYLISTISEDIISIQYSKSQNQYLSNLNLKLESIPFEEMPYCTSLAGHNPRLDSLFDCISTHNRKHEFLARRIKQLCISQNSVYISIDNLSDFGTIENIKQLIQSYNQKVYKKHNLRKILLIDSKYLCITEYDSDILQTINIIRDKAASGAERYTDYHAGWEEEYESSVDSDEKKKILKSLFSETGVAIITGPAGTGKTRLIKSVSEIYTRQKKIFLAYTHAAVENLRSKVVIGEDGMCITIKKYLQLLKKETQISADLLVIDECSIVSSHEVAEILLKTSSSAILLVGDTKQLPPLEFGNWFHIIKTFLPASAQFALETNYRSTSQDLQRLWKSVRNMDNMMSMWIARGNHSAPLGRELFSSRENDEIILTLNYNGLFGINNINLYYQNHNPNTACKHGINTYKVGDPIIFCENERFKDILHNNLKGEILEIYEHSDGLYFKLLVERIVNSREASEHNIDLYPSGEASRKSSIIGFKVNREAAQPDEESLDAFCVVPFQVAYAVSIHKSQGLEYDSVKIVITDTIEECITHNVFYTAITRARKKLKIFWNAEVERKILSSFAAADFRNDISLIFRRLNNQAQIELL